tara:strand:+ start:17716 stop:18009 length:294 start_codon:yes stop_codon:yes gene_type:complete
MDVKVSNHEGFRKKVANVAARVVNLLNLKNAQYGDSVFQPVRIFSKADSQQGLRVRIDDKLSRLARGNDSIESDIDIVEDLIGYLILLRISMDEVEE